MTAPYADLIERLRATYQHWIKGHSTQPINPDGPEAANAIEALQAEVERLSAAPPVVGREEIARIVKAAVNRARASETCPVMSFSIKWRIKECDEAVADAADAILSALGRTEAPTPPEGEGLTPGG